MYQENDKEQQKDEGWRKPKGKSNKPKKKKETRGRKNKTKLPNKHINQSNPGEYCVVSFLYIKFHWLKDGYEHIPFVNIFTQ